MGLTSCADDLNVSVIDPNTTTEGANLGDNLLNKCYANMAVAGQGGANGDCDIDGLDGGTTGFVRQLFNSQELTSDESVCGWGDQGIENYDYAIFDDSHPMLKGFYYPAPIPLHGVLRCFSWQAPRTTLRSEITRTDSLSSATVPIKDGVATVPRKSS